MNVIKGFRRLAAHCYHIMKGAPCYPNIHPTALISPDVKVSSPEHLYMGESTSIPRGATIMNGARGKFIMKRWSFSSIDLLVICGNHMPVLGMPIIKVTDALKSKLDVNHQYSKDVVVEEDVWIGARVTLLQGTHVGRGSIIAAGAVVTGCIPAYCVWGGVPAHFIKFRWSIEQILEHESLVYPENERFTRRQLEEERLKYEG